MMTHGMVLASSPCHFPSHTCWLRNEAIYDLAVLHQLHCEKMMGWSLPMSFAFNAFHASFLPCLALFPGLPRPSPAPDFDCLQKRSKSGAREGLGMRLTLFAYFLGMPSLNLLAVYNHWTGLVDWTGGLD